MQGAAQPGVVVRDKRMRPANCFDVKPLAANEGVDLAELVRSAAKPGLKDRIADYLKSS